MGALGVTVWQRLKKPASLPDQDGKQLIFPENNLDRKKRLPEMTVRAFKMAGHR